MMLSIVVERTVGEVMVEEAVMVGVLVLKALKEGGRWAWWWKMESLPRRVRHDGGAVRVGGVRGHVT